MKRLSDIPWIAIVEEDDKPDDVGRWIEKNVLPDDGFGSPLLTPYSEGDVKVDQWSLSPKPGDVIVFITPAPHSTQRYPGHLMPHKIEPMSQDQREAMEAILTSNWESRPHKSFWQLIVDMSTLAWRKTKEAFKEEI